ncbi:uncharacterized protein THITE_2074055 [Thermothielavioides terrestris NRRL 8126]|uniref:BAG domain-containing protein n=1 Tax=Thermothielavioides terrestris (strain ATCC 38088 / NRRL 8126) TaxID=578455 RepID=G2QWV3_THETT|nr:uncharacterized protein THITE_2074055 [Thermothielavioides terrestris NRRL 8126]AEO63117.1 hypothetical protein THITE_2074055 [Thermothielavioides terrestris NRRL 8126]
MSRYGFSSRGGFSPFSSQDGVPNVTDEDFSYITSADLEDHEFDFPQPYIMPHSHIVDYNHFSHSAPAPAYGQPRPEDDVMLIRYRGVTYPEHFPAYSIGDGKLLVSDVRERVMMILDLSDRQAKKIRMYYKGRRLKDPATPVRKYGVKDNSEVLVILDESGYESSESEEEAVVVGRDSRGRYEGPGESPRSPRLGRSDRVGDRSPRDSSSQVGTEVPVDDSRRRGTSRVRAHSPGSAVSAASAPVAPPVVPPVAPPVGIPGGPIEKLNNIAADFDSKWLPLCMEFAANPPMDAKKRIDEHRKLSETIMQQVLLKLDAIETSSEEGARARRKALVVEVQKALKALDDARNLI